MTDVQKIEFFFDIGSPYSYLAATQLDAVSKRTGVPVEWRPFLLGGVFKASGNDMPARVAAKGVYMFKDLSRFAMLYGVPFKFSSRFPLNTLRTQRALTGTMLTQGADAMQRLAQALYRQYWVEDQDVSADEVIVRTAVSVGLDGAAIVGGADQSAAKDRLRADTDEAVKRGAFGAPTFFVGDEMFFGNDRLVLLEAHVADLKKR
ncbi:MAG: 2-hydroxychromene-2-carboxylate isomerase [Sandaracinaceae bacterium]|nr:2-hydroxychromene-2-carboxylate isomerase [Sandaracinaceae bacterium]